ncbi:hypothetical protein PSE10C_42820 [Pseudomonas amygdali pv. eriobotryae]|nr:hypothetical protein PSE10C_42820 [Pseudomonas amygdali pv. eriobotryae]
MPDTAVVTQAVTEVEPVTGLILSGGGARAAYQVGVLAGIADLLPPGSPNPFPVIVGTSAGAINAVKLASGALHFRIAIHQLTEFWQSFRSHQVLRSDWSGVIHQASRFFGRSLMGFGRNIPVALSTARLCVNCSMSGWTCPGSRPPSMPITCAPWR